MPSGGRTRLLVPAKKMSQVLASSGSEVCLWDFGGDGGKTPKPYQTINPHGGTTIPCVRWNHNNQVLVSCGTDGGVVLSHVSGRRRFGPIYFLLCCIRASATATVDSSLLSTALALNCFRRNFFGKASHQLNCSSQLPRFLLRLPLPMLGGTKQDRGRVGLEKKSADSAF